MPPRKKVDVFDLGDLFREVGEGLVKQAREPNVHGYVPHEKQEEFHSDEAFGRLFLGGNRSGKSVAGTVESIWWLTNTHPFIETPPPPVRGRAIGVDFTKGVEQILLPLYKRWTPPEVLKGDTWDKAYRGGNERVLTFKNGSTIEFMSYEQDMDKHAGTSRHFIHFDEEPPKHIYSENMMRLLDTNGKYWITMTPLLGMTWLYEELYLPAVEKKKDRKVFSVVEVSTGDNPHLKQEAIDRVLGEIEDKQEREAREHGKFIQLGGKIFKTFDEDIHVIDPMVPDKSWAWYLSIDSGWNNPTAVLWHAVGPNNTVITFGEHYKSEMTVAEHAQVIHERNRKFGKVPEIATGDPAMRQTKEGTGTSIQTEYALNGISLALDGVPTGPGSVAIGIAKMQQYMRVRYTPEGEPVTNWYITADCVKLIEELKKLRWATYASKKVEFNNNPQEAIHKKDDHAPDSARYFFTLQPDLRPAEVAEKVPLVKSHGLVRYDDQLTQMLKVAQESPDTLAFTGVDNLYSTEGSAGTEWSVAQI